MKRLMAYSVLALFVAACSAHPLAPTARQDSPAPWTAMESVEFQWQRWDLTTTDSAKLVKVAAWLKENPAMSLALGGQGDDARASDEDVLVGLRRLRAVRAALVEAGIPAARISGGFQGRRGPPCRADSSACRASDLRVEILAAPR